MSRILKTGKWLYDGQASGLVQIITEAIEPPESEEDPPCDEDGNTFYAVYSIAGGGKSQSWYFDTFAAAVREAEGKLLQIVWDSD